MEKEVTEIERTIQNVQEDQQKHIYWLGMAFLKIKEAELDVNRFMVKIAELKTEFDELKKKESDNTPDASKVQ